MTPCRLAEVDDLWSEEHKGRKNSYFEKQANICRKARHNNPEDVHLLVVSYINDVRSSIFPASIQLRQITGSSCKEGNFRIA